MPHSGHSDGRPLLAGGDGKTVCLNLKIRAEMRWNSKIVGSASMELILQNIFHCRDLNTLLADFEIAVAEFAGDDRDVVCVESGPYQRETPDSFTLPAMKLYRIRDRSLWRNAFGIGYIKRTESGLDPRFDAFPDRQVIGIGVRRVGRKQGLLRNGESGQDP